MALWKDKNVIAVLKGDKGDKGDTGAKLVSRVLQGQDENGGNVYLDTFDDGTTATFTAPKGEGVDELKNGKELVVSDTGTGNKYFDFTAPIGTKLTITVIAGNFGFKLKDANDNDVGRIPENPNETLTAGMQVEYVTTGDVAKVGGWFSPAASFIVKTQGYDDKIAELETDIDRTNQMISGLKSGNVLTIENSGMDYQFFNFVVPKGTKLTVTSDSSNTGTFSIYIKDANGNQERIIKELFAGQTITSNAIPFDAVQVGGYFNADSKFTVKFEEYYELKNGKELVVTNATGTKRFDFTAPIGTKLTITASSSNEGSFGFNVYGANGESQRIPENPNETLTAGMQVEYVTTFDVVQVGGYFSPAASFIVKTQGYDDKIAEQNTKIAELETDIDRTNQMITEVKKWNNAINIDFASQEQNSGTVEIGTDGCWWVAFGTLAKHCVIPISYGMRVKIHANNEYDNKVVFVSSYSAPTSVSDRINHTGFLTVESNTTMTIPVPYGSKYVIVNAILSNGMNALPQSMSIEFDEEIAEVYRNARTKKVSVQFGEPITILSNTDQDATLDEKLKLSYFNIVQLSDKMYYLYYAAYGDGPIQEYNQNLLFAYSTDGINYTRGFPEGITPPFEGTNKIFSNATITNFTGQNIFKCLDPEYPWRLVCQQQAGDDPNIHHVYMIKSKDGINFDETTKRVLQYGIVNKVQNLHDTQYGVVCRGNIIKFFSRKNINYYIGAHLHKSREITVAYYDLDGNTILPEKTLPLRFVYNSAAIPFDDRRELITPTGFDNSDINGVRDQSYTLNMYTVDGHLVNEVESNISSIIEEDDKWISFAPSMITIGDTQYLTYKTTDFEHDTTPTLVSVSRYRIVPIVIDRE